MQSLNDILEHYELSEVNVRALSFFFRNHYESLIIVNREGIIEFMDRGSEKLFELPKGGAKGLHIRQILPDTNIPRVLETGYPSVGNVLNVKGMRKISSIYPLKERGEVVGAIGRILFNSLEEVERITTEMNQLKIEVKSLRQKQQSEHRARYTFDNILGETGEMVKAKQIAKRISMVNTDVLITGESGTGKELVAQAIHNFSMPEAPFVRVNCPAIPLDLAESELFGYEKGAFSGANTAGKQGKFELADQGTVFLDEIHTLPLSIQAKLLRVLQEREVERLGSTTIKRLNFRIVATSNVDLRRIAEEGKFRKDLYHRIARTVIRIPSLRERKMDIPIFIDYFLKIINKQFSTRFNRLSEEALDCLMNYDWSGNVRDLINALEQACLQQWEGDEIQTGSLPEYLTEFFSQKRDPLSSDAFIMLKPLQKQEREMIVQALEATKGNKLKAAQSLNMPRSTFYNKLKEYQISY